MTYEVIKYLAVCANEKLPRSIGQRGAEMVEYAIVLACIAAVGVAYFRPDKTATGGAGTATLNGALTDLWNIISSKADAILGK